MNADDLHTVLVDLAGPPPDATPAARAAVRDRVRRGRRRVGFATGAVAVVVALLGVGAAQSFADDGSRSDVSVAARAASCDRLPPAVAPAAVPAAARRWADGRAVVGHGSLWTGRRNLGQTGVHEGAIRRYKLGWLVLPPGPAATPPTLRARRIDRPGTATGDANAAFDGRGSWFASTIEIPARGCWQITARHGGDTIVFRRAVG